MKPKKYSGNDELEGFISFIRREAGVKPLIINGETDLVDYDYIDDNAIVAESEEDIDKIVEGEDIVTTTSSPTTTTKTTTTTKSKSTVTSTTTPTPADAAGHDEL